MKGQRKKGWRLAACGLAAALVMALVPVSALAANCNTSNNSGQNAYNFIQMFNQQKNSGGTASQNNCTGSSCTPSDVLNALQNCTGSSCTTADLQNALKNCTGSSCTPSDVLNAVKGVSSGNTANCNPSDILNALKNGGSVDVNSLYKYLCPTTPACTPKPTSAPKPTATPKPTAAPTATPVPGETNPGTSASALEAQMVDLINAERAKAGVAPLTINTKVTEVARAKSKDMIDKGYFSHTSPTYGSPFDMLKSFGVSYRTAGENIAMNRSMTSAHTALMNSQGHRQNILNASYKSIGVGIVTNASGYLYITQMFIG